MRQCDRKSILKLFDELENAKLPPVVAEFFTLGPKGSPQMSARDYNVIELNTRRLRLKLNRLVTLGDEQSLAEALAEIETFTGNAERIATELVSAQVAVKLGTEMVEDSTRKLQLAMAEAEGIKRTLQATHGPEAVRSARRWAFVGGSVFGLMLCLMLF